MTWAFLVKTLCGQYNAHLFFVLLANLIIYARIDKRHDREKDATAYKFGYVGEKLTEIKDVLGTHTEKIEAIDKNMTHLEKKFERLKNGKEENNSTTG